MKRKSRNGGERGFLPVSWKPTGCGTAYRIGTGSGGKTLEIIRRSRDRRTKG